jgi:spore coat protein CotH
LIADTPDSEWEVVLGARMDLDNLIDSYALDAVTDHFDDYFFNGNNYYLYHHPRTGKFLMIPHGMDESLGFQRDPLRQPLGSWACASVACRRWTVAFARR